MVVETAGGAMSDEELFGLPDDDPPPSWHPMRGGQRPTRDSMGATVLWIMQAFTHGWFGYPSGPTVIESRLLAYYRAGLIPISDVMKWAISQRRGRWSK